MSSIKKLAGQTAIYGVSSIVGRVFNYFLTPLYTYQFATNEYGVVTEMYAYVAFLVVLLTYGMETAYFRFASSHPKEKAGSVYATALIPISVTSTLFIIGCTIFSHDIATWLRYPNHQEFVIWFAIIVGLDAFSAIPLARLRQENRPRHFAFVNLASIGVNIFLNLFFIAYCKVQYDNGNTNWVVDTFYDPSIGVGYIFIANLLASITKPLLLLPYLKTSFQMFDQQLFKGMMWYALPLLFAGLAGIINETIDRIMIKNILIDSQGKQETLSQLGIYGACYKVSILITLFIQAFRYAAEPFFFSKAQDKNAKKTYSEVMKYFVIVCSFIFLSIMLYIDVVMKFVGEDYREGAVVVPILLLANICLGIYYNQSVWYKLTNQTRFGAYIAIGGALVTILLNWFWIPRIGYVGSAWATLICYASMMIASYVLGQKRYPIHYNLRKIALFLGLAIGLVLLNNSLSIESVMIKYGVSTLLLFVFIGVVLFFEQPLKLIRNRE